MNCELLWFPHFITNVKAKWRTGDSSSSSFAINQVALDTCNESAKGEFCIVEQSMEVKRIIILRPYAHPCLLQSTHHKGTVSFEWKKKKHTKSPLKIILSVKWKAKVCLCISSSIGDFYIILHSFLRSLEEGIMRRFMSFIHLSILHRVSKLSIKWILVTRPIRLLQGAQLI